MKFHRHRILSTLNVLLWTIFVSCGAVLGIIPAPTVTVTNSTALNVQFQMVDEASTYHITLSSKHGDASSRKVETSSSPIDIEGLTAGIWYEATVEALHANEIVENSDAVSVQTFPGPPTVRTGQALPNSVTVFFESKISMIVTKWKIQYRKESSQATTVDSTSGTYGAFWLSGLQPNTAYEVRAGVAELRDTITITDVEYSSWVKFSTDKLSVFGRVVLSDVTYTASYSTANSAEWNETRSALTAAYSDRSSAFTSLSIERIKNSGGKPLVHYQLKVEDASLPSSTDFTLTGSAFSDSLLNNGGIVTGTTYTERISTKYTLFYLPSDSSPSSCTPLVERYMLVSVEGSESLEIHLNVADSSATTADEEDGLKITGTNLIRDDGLTSATVQPNKILGLVPKFVLEDCLDTQLSTSLYALIYESEDYTTNAATNFFFHTTDVSSSALNEAALTATNYTENSTLVVKIPAVDKAVKYELLQPSSAGTPAVLEEDIDESNVLKMTVQNALSAGQYLLRVTTKKSDGTTATFNSAALTITSVPGGVPSDTPCFDREANIDKSAVNVTYFGSNNSLIVDVPVVAKATKYEFTDAAGVVVGIGNTDEVDKVSFIVDDVTSLLNLEAPYILKATIGTCAGPNITSILESGIRSDVNQCGNCSEKRYCGVADGGDVYCVDVVSGAQQLQFVPALLLVVSTFPLYVFM